MRSIQARNHLFTGTSKSLLTYSVLHFHVILLTLEKSEAQCLHKKAVSSADVRGFVCRLAKQKVYLMFMVKGKKKSKITFLLLNHLFDFKKL